MKVRVIKIEELEDALHPNNMALFFDKTYEVLEKHFEKPQIGRRFYCGTLSTSGVVEIISENTFKTHSSIYNWEIVE